MATHDHKFERSFQGKDHHKNEIDDSEGLRDFVLRETRGDIDLNAQQDGIGHDEDHDDIGEQSR